MTYTKEQQKENRQKWVNALRSGEYKQTTKALKKVIKGNPHYCCLGVACDLFIKDGGDLIEDKTEQSRCYFRSNKGCWNDAYLPHEVQQWLGLNTCKGSFKNNNGEMDSLAILNDTNHSFEDIANIIEEEPIELLS